MEDSSASGSVGEKVTSPLQSSSSQDDDAVRAGISGSGSSGSDPLSSVKSSITRVRAPECLLKFDSAIKCLEQRGHRSSCASEINDFLACNNALFAQAILAKDDDDTGRGRPAETVIELYTRIGNETNDFMRVRVRRALERNIQDMKRQLENARKAQNEKEDSAGPSTPAPSTSTELSSADRDSTASTSWSPPTSPQSAQGDKDDRHFKRTTVRPTPSDSDLHENTDLLDRGK